MNEAETRAEHIDPALKGHVHVRAAVNPTVLMLALATAACMPQWAERQVPVLEGRGLDDYTIRHEEAGDCVMRHLLPVSYEVQRPRYTLRIRPHVAYAGEPLSLEMILEAPGATVTAVGADLTDQGSARPGVQRYRVVADPETAGEMAFEVWRGGEKLGAEQFRVTAERCRALLWKGRE